MIDVENVIRIELERLAPPDETPAPEWERVAAAAGAPAGARNPARRLALVAAAGVLAVAVPAVAFSADVRSFLGLGHPRPVLARAILVVSAPIGNGFYAHLWHAPSSTGGRCSFTTAGRGALPRRLLVRRGGGACTSRGTRDVDRADAADPFTLGMSIQRRLAKGNPRRWVPPVVSGNVYGGLHATRVRIEWRRGSHPLAFENGYFIGGTPRLYVPPFADFPFYVVAYDAGGREVARKKLENPALRLMSGGWEQYAREYHAWKRAQRR